MLATLSPSRTGLGFAIKRRNSKSYENGRRDSFSIFSSYSLPSSQESLRRFSSYDTLFQSMLETSTHVHQSPPPAPVETRLKGRRASISRLISRKNSIGRKDFDEGRRKSVFLDPLDLQLAKIREQLDQMKSQDLDILQRVEDLSNSVQELCNQQQPQGIPHSTSVNSLRVIRESHLETGSIETISESSDSEEDDQSFEEYCRTNLALIGDRRVSTTSTTTVLSSVKIVIESVDDDRAEQSVLNNSPYVITHKAQSYLSDDSDRDFEKSEELSMKSEPLMITHAEHLACTVTPVH